MRSTLVLALALSACGVGSAQSGSGGVTPSGSAGNGQAGSSGRGGTGGVARDGSRGGSGGSAATGVGGEGGTGGGTGLAGAAGGTAPTGEFAAAAPGDVVEIPIGRLHPTQGALGFDQIFYKLGRYQVEHVKELDDYCLDEGLAAVIPGTVTAASRLDDPSSFACAQNASSRDTSILNPAVVGPNGDTLFVVDGHHGLTSYSEAPDGGPGVHVHVRVIANYADLGTASFWRQMQAVGWVWLRDGDDKKIVPADLPGRLGLDAGFSNDPFRSLAYFVRDVGFQKPATPVPFLEFHWAHWLRTKIPLGIYDLADITSYLSATQTAATTIVALNDTDDVDGLTAGALGRMPSFSSSEFTKLSAPISSGKPGKIAYALRYRGGNANPGSRYVTAQTGDLIDVVLSDLHPTQPSIGYDHVFYKLGRYRSAKDVAAGGINKRFHDWCEVNGQRSASTVNAGARLDTPASFTCTVPIGSESAATIAAMKTAVVGPRGQLFLTDGHNTFTAFWHTPDGGPALHVRVRVLANVSYLNAGAFWQGMEARGWSWLRDGDDQPIASAELPPRLGLDSLQNNRYYALAFFTRNIGYAKDPDAPEHLELLWGAWLRRRYDLASYDLTDLTTYLALVKAASQDMAALASTDVVIDDWTAFILARITPWNDGAPEDGGEFAKISRPLTDVSPGKIAYALDYAASP